MVSQNDGEDQQGKGDKELKPPEPRDERPGRAEDLSKRHVPNVFVAQRRPKG